MRGSGASLCGYDILAIPDGIREDSAGQKHLDLSLIVTPAWDDEGRLELARWPDEIFDLVAAEATIAFRTYGGEHASVPARSELNEYLVDLRANTEAKKTPTVLWENIFHSEPNQPTDWAVLESGLKRIADSCEGGITGPNNSTARVAKCETSRVDALFQAFELLATEKVLQGNGQKQKTKLAQRVFRAVRDRVFSHDQSERQTLFDPGRHDDSWHNLDLITAAFATQVPSATNLVTEDTFDSVVEDIASAIPDLGDFSKEDELQSIAEQDAVETALGKLMSLKALPTLSHYFGLSVQLSVDLDSLVSILPANLEGLQVSANLGGIPPVKRVWTAVDLAVDTDVRFEAAYYGYPDPEFAAEDGLLVQPDTETPRYWISERDPVNTVIAGIMLADDDVEFEQWFLNFNAKSKGINLFDSLSTESLASASNSARDCLDVYYAEDLAWGLRPDIGVVLPRIEDEPREVKWLSTTAREIRCEDIDLLFFDHDVVKRMAYRDHGLAFALEKKERDETDGESKVVSKTDEVFNWVGESLAVSRALVGGMRVNPLEMLNLNLHYGLEQQEDQGDAWNGLPILRSGVEYVVGCRVAMQNGAGRRRPTSNETVYEDKNIIGTRVLNGGSGVVSVVPLRYLGPIPGAPSIHLNDDGWLAREKGRTYGDRADVLVIRSEGGHDLKLDSGTERRFLTPPRVNFDVAENQGQFDAADRVVGAFRKFIRSPETGAFPEVRKGEKYWWRVDDSVETKRTILARLGTLEEVLLSDAGGSRGTVLVRGDSRRHEPTFVHSLAGLLFSDRSGDEHVHFWKASERPSQSDVIELRLEDADTPNGDLMVSMDDRRKRITVKVPAASSTKVRFSARDRVGALRVKNVLPVTFVHAVRKPLRRPEGVGDGLGVFPVTIDESRINGAAGISTADSTNPISPAWRGYVLDQGNQPPSTWDGHESGGVTYFTGRIGIHRRSTGSISCVGSWEEYGLNSIRRGSNGLWTKATKPVVETLFETEIVSDYLERDSVDLLYDESGDQLRALSYSFSDSRARRLSLTLTAVSSYKDYFPGSDDEDSIDVFCESDRLDEVWVKSTMRPLVPAIDRTLPLFNWKKAKTAKKTYEIRRSTSYRVFLSDWYSSGEGEQLAVVMLPRVIEGVDSTGAESFKLAVEPKSVCDYGVDDTFLEYMPRFSRDLALGSGPQPFVIDPEHLGKTNQDLVNHVKLFLGKNQGIDGSGISSPDDGKKMEVSILPLRNSEGRYDPEIDPEMGPYFDIELSGSGLDQVAQDYWPFVQVSLVRYQPNSVGNLQLSHPVQLQLQKLPERKVTVSGPNNFKTKLVVQGDKPYEREAATPSLVLTAHLLEYDEFTDEWSHIDSTKLEASYDGADSVLYVGEFEVGLKKRALMLDEYEEFSTSSSRSVFSTMIEIN